MTCVQCREHAVVLLTRARPLLRNSTYQICPSCARLIRSLQDAAQQSADMLAGTTTNSPARDNGDAGKLAGRGQGNL
jgi:hypothetical protein